MTSPGLILRPTVTSTPVPSPYSSRPGAARGLPALVSRTPGRPRGAGSRRSLGRPIRAGSAPSRGRPATDSRRATASRRRFTGLDRSMELPTTSAYGAGCSCRASSCRKRSLGASGGALTVGGGHAPGSNPQLSQIAFKPPRSTTGTRSSARGRAVAAPVAGGEIARPVGPALEGGADRVRRGRRAVVGEIGTDRRALEPRQARSGRDVSSRRASTPCPASARRMPAQSWTTTRSPTPAVSASVCPAERGSVQYGARARSFTTAPVGRHRRQRAGADLRVADEDLVDRKVVDLGPDVIDGAAPEAGEVGGEERGIPALGRLLVVAQERHRSRSAG